MNKVRKWRPGNKSLSVIRYNENDHSRSIGHCKIKPKDGDLVVCVKPAGDFFDSYIIIRKNKEGYYKNQGEFGAYEFGTPLGTISMKNFYLLMAKEPIKLPKKFET